MREPEARNAAIDRQVVDIGAMSPDEQIRLFDRSRRFLAFDPFRPWFHFSSPSAMIHDPSGLCHWQGKCHLFYQYHGQRWRSAKGHAVSDDLVRWCDLPGPKSHGNLHNARQWCT
jgi:sucrose-6-phosphate hydrolase SacC (GH32 family)